MKYSAEQLKDMLKKGWAIPNENGEPSYPIADKEDLLNAIHAVGRGSVDHDKIRKYIIGRAKDLGLEDLIPDNWNPDGSLKNNKNSLPYALTGELRTVRKMFGGRETLSTIPDNLHVRLSEPHVADFTGYASVTETPYTVTDWLGEYRETVKNGAFAKTLRETEFVPLLVNHEGIPLASTRSGTLHLSEDGHGLLVQAKLDRRQSVTNDACIAVERGDMVKMSFAFRAIQESWNTDYTERAISELQLYDVSLVTYPANPATSADVRSAIRGTLGRDGLGLVYAARQLLTSGEYRNQTAEPVLEQTFRALVEAEKRAAKQYGFSLSPRSQIIAALLLEARAGRVLSAANEAMLKKALDVLWNADKQLTVVDEALDEAQAVISNVLGVANPDGGPGDPDDDGQPGVQLPNNSGLDADAGGGVKDKNSTGSLDGLGPRSVPLSVLAAKRELELLRLRKR